MIVLPVAVLVLAGLALGGIKLFASGPESTIPENTSSQAAPATFNGAAEILSRRLPEGFGLKGDLLAEGTAHAGFTHRFSVTLAPIQAYGVPFKEIDPPADWPAGLRSLAPELSIDRRSPRGQTFAIENATRLDDGTLVHAVWHVNLVQGPTEWVIEGRDSLEVALVVGQTQVEEQAILSAEELERFPAREKAVLVSIRTAWGRVEEDIATFEREAARGVPPACTKDLSPIIREVVRLSTACPRIQEENERNACFINRDRLNSEIGACETQTKLHEEGLARARQAAAPYAEKRIATFREELQLDS